MTARKVLVVDDEKYIRDLLANLLTEKDWEVDVAEDGEQALQKLTQAEFGVILSDIKMPRMDGFTLLKNVKRDYPEVAVVMMTGFSQQHTIREALSLGAEEYLPKPFRVEELVMAVERAQQKAKIRNGKDKTPNIA